KRRVGRLGGTAWISSDAFIAALTSRHGSRVPRLFAGAVVRSRRFSGRQHRLDRATGLAGRRRAYAAPAEHRSREAVMQTDLPLSELRRYQPEVAEPADFDEFWADELATARAVPTALSLEAVDDSVRHAAVYDVTFAGHGGDPIKGWLLDPHGADSNAAVIVEYVGYGGGRGDPFDWLTWTCAGHPHVIMDTRGQGGGWLGADTHDPGDNRAPSSPGLLTPRVAAPGSPHHPPPVVS